MSLAELDIEITREWQMPTRETFKMPCVRWLLSKYKVGKGWIDPFAGDNSPAEITNDLNPNKRTAYHMHALDFVNSQTIKFMGCLFDPPYSPRQAKECYNEIGIDFTKANGQEAPHFSKVKDALKDKITYAITFGWNSSGFGEVRGFRIIEIMLINHGGNGHNDTIVTVEKRINS